MRKSIFVIVCAATLATITSSHAAYIDNFNGPFPIEGTAYSISTHKNIPFCFINASFVNGAELAVFQFPRGWSLLFTPDGDSLWTSSVESAKIALHLDAKIWEVNRKIHRSPNGRAIVIDIDDSTEASFITELSRAHDLIVYINGKYENAFSLKGSSRALTSLGAV